MSENGFDLEVKALGDGEAFHYECEGHSFPKGLVHTLSNMLEASRHKLVVTGCHGTLADFLTMKKAGFREPGLFRITNRLFIENFYRAANIAMHEWWDEDLSEEGEEDGVATADATERSRTD